MCKIKRFVHFNWQFNSINSINSINLKEISDELYGKIKLCTSIGYVVCMAQLLPKEDIIVS